MKTAMRATSLDAYQHLQPRLGWAQREVYKLLRSATLWDRDMTNMEIARALRWSVNRVTGRTNELVKAGLVKPCRRRRCGVTGHQAIAWRTTK